MPHPSVNPNSIPQLIAVSTQANQEICGGQNELWSQANFEAPTTLSLMQTRAKAAEEAEDKRGQSLPIRRRASSKPRGKSPAPELPTGGASPAHNDSSDLPGRRSKRTEEVEPEHKEILGDGIDDLRTHGRSNEERADKGVASGTWGGILILGILILACIVALLLLFWPTPERADPDVRLRLRGKLQEAFGDEQWVAAHIVEQALVTQLKGLSGRTAERAKGFLFAGGNQTLYDKMTHVISTFMSDEFPSGKSNTLMLGCGIGSGWDDETEKKVRESIFYQVSPSAHTASPSRPRALRSKQNPTKGGPAVRIVVPKA